MYPLARPSREWLVPATVGLVAPHALIGIWGVLVAGVWLPFWKWAWTSHQVKRRELTVDPSPFFDGVVGFAIGAATAYLLMHCARGPLWRVWFLFAAAFAVSSVVFEWPADWSLVRFAIAQPLFFGFVAALVLATWQGLRRKRVPHVP